MEDLQLILGLDKKNPLFSVYLSEITPEIESYARSRSRDIYQSNHYDYSNCVCQEIQEHFQTKLSAETLRPFFRDEKQLVSSTARSAENSKKNDSICDSEEYSSSENEANRKQISSLPLVANGEFVHHAGILLLLYLVINITK